MPRHVQVVPPNPRWAALFQAEAAIITQALGQEVVAIHHIGSTAIPGISAKPIIDILVDVRDILRIDACNPAMLRLGYEPKGEYGIPGRRFFIKGGDEQRSHHVHVFQCGNPEIQRHLDFRDYLIAHPETAQEYSQLKQELARRFPTDIDAYMAGKDAFIREIDRRACAWRRAD